MKKRIGIWILSLLMFMSSIGLGAYAANAVITAVDLPVSETMFYTGASITNPVFYDTLDCTVGGNTVSVSGFKWTCSNYSAATAGTYTFTASAPSGYSFGCTAPTIKVTVKSGDISSHRGHFESNDLTGLKATVKGVEGTYNRLYDLTGFNELRAASTADISSGVRISGGIDYKSKMVKATTSHIVVSGANVQGVYGGSYGTNYIGTSDITIENSNVSEVFAGSINGTFSGTTNIWVGGSSAVSKISCGGIYSTDATVSSSNLTVVGGADVTYTGIVNIYIDATDIIGLKQNPTNGRRFSPIFLFIGHFSIQNEKMLLLKQRRKIEYGKDKAFVDFSKSMNAFFHF